MPRSKHCRNIYLIGCLEREREREREREGGARAGGQNGGELTRTRPYGPNNYIIRRKYTPIPQRTLLTLLHH